MRRPSATPLLPVLSSALLGPALLGATLAMPFAALAAEEAPRAVTVARATAIPACSVFVDAASKGGDGSIAKPHRTIGAAVEAAPAGAVICVAEGAYSDALVPGAKHFTLAGGFQRGSGFKVRDSATYVSKVTGKGGSFLHIDQDAGPVNQLTAIDGFDISGFSQAILRDYWEPQRFDVTNNAIHDNACSDATRAGAGVALINVSGSITGNVFRNNACGRGGAIFLNNANAVTIARNLIDGNAGTEPDSAHGGAVYVFGEALTITGNLFTNNRVSQWGGGLYVGAYRPGNQPTTATMSWNVYRGNKAGNSGGGFFCDDGATCHSTHEIYAGNCGGNVLVDGGAQGSGPTVATFDRITNVGALSPDCKSPGTGLIVDTWEALDADQYTITNAIFWGNAPGQDFSTSCGSGCAGIKVAVSHAMVQTAYPKEGIAIKFGAGVVAPADPMFVAPDTGDYRLKADSPARGKGAKGVDLGALSDGAAAPVAAEPPAPAAPELAIEPEPKAEAPSAIAAPEPPAKKAARADPQLSAKEAFKAAKDLGTADAWNAFLASYPNGFEADLARAYLKKLAQ